MSEIDRRERRFNARRKGTNPPTESNRRERNELVHGIWTAEKSSPGVAMIHTSNLDRAEVMRDRLVTVADLDALVEHLEEWIIDYATLGAQFGFPRHKNATQAVFFEQNERLRNDDALLYAAIRVAG